jgi:hypothetical protein
MPTSSHPHLEASPSFSFLSRWRVRGTCGEVSDILNDAVGLARWWPSVYLDVQQISPPGPQGIGRRVRLHTKGWLPYTLRWESVVVSSSYPNGFTLDATGDFEGRGVWTFTQDGDFVDIVYDWKVRAQKPIIRRLSFVLRPLFEANHRWAMAQGEESLELELARRRATSDEAWAAIPAPPGPVTFAGIGLLAAGALAAGGAAYLILRALRRRR